MRHRFKQVYGASLAIVGATASSDAQQPFVNRIEEGIFSRAEFFEDKDFDNDVKPEFADGILELDPSDLELPDFSPCQEEERTERSDGINMSALPPFTSSGDSLRVSQQKQLCQKWSHRKQSTLTILSCTSAELFVSPRSVGTERSSGENESGEASEEFATIDEFGRFCIADMIEVHSLEQLDSALVEYHFLRQFGNVPSFLLPILSHVAHYMRAWEGREKSVAVCPRVVVVHARTEDEARSSLLHVSESLAPHNDTLHVVAVVAGCADSVPVCETVDLEGGTTVTRVQLSAMSPHDALLYVQALLRACDLSEDVAPHLVALAGRCKRDIRRAVRIYAAAAADESASLGDIPDAVLESLRQETNDTAPIDRQIKELCDLALTPLESLEVNTPQDKAGRFLSLLHYLHHKTTQATVTSNNIESSTNGGAQSARPKSTQDTALDGGSGGRLRHHVAVKEVLDTVLRRDASLLHTCLSCVADGPVAVEVVPPDATVHSLLDFDVAPVSLLVFDTLKTLLHDNKTLCQRYERAVRLLELHDAMRAVEQQHIPRLQHELALAQQLHAQARALSNIQSRQKECQQLQLQALVAQQALRTHATAHARQVRLVAQELLSLSRSGEARLCEALAQQLDALVFFDFAGLE
ncbi:MAG: hypothetical protein MHM6MM_001292 [Cercozoa sp. M6MM]